MSVKGTGQRPPLQRTDGVRDLKSLVDTQTTQETQSTQKKSLSKPIPQTESQFKKVKTTDTNQPSDPPKPSTLERSPRKGKPPLTKRKHEMNLKKKLPPKGILKKPGTETDGPKKTVTFNKKVKVGIIPEDSNAPIKEGKTKKLVKGRKDGPERLGKGERLPGFEGRVSRNQNEGVKGNPKKKTVEDGIPDVPKDIKETFGNLF
jgi:hypothetical protein